MDPLISQIDSNSITPLINAKSVQNWQWQADKHPKNQNPNILQNLDKIDHLQPS